MDLSSGELLECSLFPIVNYGSMEYFRRVLESETRGSKVAFTTAKQPMFTVPGNYLSIGSLARISRTALHT